MRDSVSGRFNSKENKAAGVFAVRASEVKISAKIFM